MYLGPEKEVQAHLPRLRQTQVSVKMPEDKVVCRECEELKRWAVYYFADGTGKCTECLNKKYFENLNNKA